MKIIGLLFLTLVIISCGRSEEGKADSEEKKAVCDAFDALYGCLQKEDYEQFHSCGSNAKSNVNIAGIKFRQMMDDASELKLLELLIPATKTHSSCITFSGENMNRASAALDAEVGLEKGLIIQKKKAILNQADKEARECTRNYVNTGKNIYECD